MMGQPPTAPHPARPCSLSEFRSSQPSPRDDRRKQVLELSAVVMSFRRRLLDALTVLPEPAATSDELDDADLDSVSGGNAWTDPDARW